MNIEKIIKGLMKEYDLSKEDIASRLGVTSNTVYRWLKGEASPKSRLVIKAIERLVEELRKSKFQ